MVKKAKASSKKKTATKKTVTRKAAKTAQKAPAKKVAEKKPLAAKKTASAKREKTVELKPTAPVLSNVVGFHTGEIAPDFSLPDAHGKTHRLSDYRGRKVVLYFYPKDNTPGCTIEACDFRDKNTAINNAGAVTFGISPDNGPSHQKFIIKYNLGFTLLSDLNKEVAKLFGVWKEKNNYGQTYWGIERTTFVVDEDGRIVRVFPKVQVQGHVEQVLEYLKGGTTANGKRENSALGT